MKRYFVSIFILNLLLIPALALAQSEADLPAGQAGLQSQIDAKAKELEAVTQKIQETQNVLQAETVRGQTLKQEINKIDTSIKTVSLGIAKSELLVDKLDLEIQSLSNDIVTKEELMEHKKAAVVQIMQSLQARDNENLLLLVLNSASLADSLAEVQNLADLNTELVGQVAEMRELREQLLTRKDQVTEKKGSVEIESQTLRAQKNIAEDQRAERARILAETKNREDNYKKLISDLEKQQQAISEEIDKIEAELRGSYDPSAAPTKRKGVFMYPVSAPRVSQLYGQTAFAARAYKTKFHNGTDFAVPIGTPIMAAADGVITTVGNNGRVQYGKYIVIKHNNNLSTLYAHLSRQAVTEGTQVHEGDIIGYSGNTGYSTGPHLHFTVYLSASIVLKTIKGAGIVPAGFTLNPMDYL